MQGKLLCDCEGDLYEEKMITRCHCLDDSLNYQNGIFSAKRNSIFGNSIHTKLLCNVDLII